MSAVILSILSAILLSVSFSSFNLWQFSWFGFIPLFIALENKTLRQSFIIAYFCGIIFWSLTMYWLIHVTLTGQIILILYLAFYFGAFGCIIYLRRFFSARNFLFFIPAGWVLLEYVRSYLFTGFPWALIGFSQYKNLPIIQVADITGAWGVSFLVIFVNLALYLILRKEIKFKKILIYSIVLFLPLFYGFFRLADKPKPVEGAKHFKISVIQGNIPQSLKWNRQAVNFIQDSYKGLTIEAAKENPNLVIWPEASVPGIWGQDEAEFRQVFSLASQLNINLLAGAVSCYGQKYFNSALFIDKSGQLSDIYNKLHLVPFGEFVPFKNIFPFLETIAPIGDIEPGRDYTIFKYPVNTLAPPTARLSTNPEENQGIGFGVLICFEDLFPELSRQFIKKGARFLVNITNDAWYKEGSAPYQHFAASVFRSVENRVYLARAANTGISGFIDPAGRILSTVHNALGKEIFVGGYSNQDIYLAPVKYTFYNRYGDFFVLICLLLDACAIIFALKNRR